MPTEPSARLSCIEKSGLFDQSQDYVMDGRLDTGGRVRSRADVGYPGGRAHGAVHLERCEVLGGEYGLGLGEDRVDAVVLFDHRGIVVGRIAQGGRVVAHGKIGQLGGGFNGHSLDAALIGFGGSEDWQKMRRTALVPALCPLKRSGRL